MALKTLLTFTFCMLLIPSFTNAQGQTATPSATFIDQLCPTIVVLCPTELVPTGSGVTFNAQISGAGPDPHLTFAWTVTGGTIIDGQGTPVIKVDTTGLSVQQLTATIEVGGLDVSCTKTATCSVTIARPPVDGHFDMYGAIRLRDEHARLDNFANELQVNPGARGYIITYGGRRGRVGEARRRAARAKSYLVGRRRSPLRVL